MVRCESQLLRKCYVASGEGRILEEIKGPWVARAMLMAVPPLRRGAHHLSRTLRRDRYNDSNGLGDEKVEGSLPETM